MTRVTWRVTSFDPAVPMRLHLVLESDRPETVELVEAAAHHWGVELEIVGAEDTEVCGVLVSAGWHHEGPQPPGRCKLERGHPGRHEA